MEFYVYQLIDPRDNKPFYVGKGKGKRMYSHLKEKGFSKKNKMIEEIKLAGLEVVCVTVKLFRTENAAYNYEKRLIKKIGRENLTNLTDGGRGAPAWIEGVKDPTIDLDKSWVGLLAVMCRKTAGFTLQPIFRLGEFWVPIEDANVDKLRDAATNVINKRGLDWANEIAKKDGVNFEFSKIDNIDKLYGYRIQKRRQAKGLSEQREQVA